LVGQVYRNKDGSEPAEAVKKVLQQLSGAADLTVAEWAEARTKKPKIAAKRPAKPKANAIAPEEALSGLERADTHAKLRDAVASLALSAGDWQALAKRLTGRSAKSGKAARETVETHFSDRLLLDERIEGVKRQFG
jgi:hypothetical protein